MIHQILKKFEKAEKDRTFPFSEWHRRDVFEKLIKPLFVSLGYNPDDINYDDERLGDTEIQVQKGLKIKIYISSLQEKENFQRGKINAVTDTLPIGTERPSYELAVVTNFESWFFFFEGREIYALSADRLEKEFETIKALLSKEAIQTGKFKEVARKLLHKEDNESLRQELNYLREKIANRILQERTNFHHLKKPDGSWNNEILNEITTRWITRFLSLKLAEDSGITFNFTLRDIRRSFELWSSKAKPVGSSKVKEDTLSNAIRVLMNEFERRYNGGIFMYEEGVDYITIPDTAFFDLLDFTTGWAFTVEDARIIGFIYERFLGQEIVVEEKKGKPVALLKNIGEARGRRKAGGIYYTPKYIVDYIVENTLGEIFKEKREKIEKAINNLDCDTFLSAVKEVKSLKVLDPACGSGSFLIKVLAEFKNFYEEIKEKKEELERKINSLRREKEKSKQQLLFTKDKDIQEMQSKFYQLQKEIEEIKFPGIYALRHNIYGVDIDPKAVDITAFTLMVQVYDELKQDARCPTMIGENLKIGNSLVSAITPDKRDNFISRKEIEEKFREEIKELITLREIEKKIDILEEEELKKIIKENFNEVVDVYLRIREKYPNALPTYQQKLLSEWHKRAKNEPIEKTYDVLINQTGLARIFLKEVYFEKIEEIKEKIEFEINKPLVKYFNSKKQVLKESELKEILEDEEHLKEEYRFIRDRAPEISKSQPPKVFNWEIEFPEVFFNEDGTLKENPGFDVVVGNPPYIDYREVESITHYYFKSIYLSCIGNREKYNLYVVFEEKALLLTKRNGHQSFIIPVNFLCSLMALKLRKFIIDSYSISKILDVSNFKVFKEAAIYPIVLVLKKRHNPENEIEIFYKINEERLSKDKIFSNKLKQNYINNFPLDSILIDSRLDILSIVQKLLNRQALGDFHELKWGTSQSGYNTKIKTRPARGLKRFAVTENIDNYFLIDTNKYIPENIFPKDQRLRFSCPKIVIARQSTKLKAAVDFEGFYLGKVSFFNISNRNDGLFLLSLLNSSVLDFIFKKLYEPLHLGGGFIRYDTPYLSTLPIIHATKDQQVPIISLVDAIIQKKKEYYAISQNIEDYIDFGEINLIRLDEFLNKIVEDFEVSSSLKVKNDNFDALRIKIEGNNAILEYGIRRKIEEYEEVDEEDEQVEIKGKYILEWHNAGSGKIKDRLAIEFLEKALEGIKNFSKAKQKSLEQKIAEVKVSEFNDRIKEGFLKFKSAIQKAKQLDEEITKIDRAIDRLVYDLYGLTEEEIKTVEKSVWGEKFEEMYRKLPTKEEALKLSEEVRDE